jgi:hypothetical protein
MTSVIEQMQDEAVAQQNVPDDSWWTYRGASGHKTPEALIHVIKASEEEFQKVVYVTTGNARVKYYKTYTEHRDEHEIRQMAQMEQGLETISLRQFKLWISQGTFQPFNGKHA